jgi:hypothetical protein
VNRDNGRFIQWKWRTPVECLQLREDYEKESREDQGWQSNEFQEVPVRGKQIALCSQHDDWIVEKQTELEHVSPETIDRRPNGSAIGELPENDDHQPSA